MMSIQGAIWGIQDLLTHQTHWGRRHQDQHAGSNMRHTGPSDSPNSLGGGGIRMGGGIGEQQERRNLSTHQTHWGSVCRQQYGADRTSHQTHWGRRDLD